MITHYGSLDSGNCYNPRLVAATLRLSYRHVEISSRDGSTRTDAFLARNPNGKVPLLELEDGRLLWESNAILLYMAEGTRFLPSDRYGRGVVHQWLFFEQYSHEPYVAVRRALVRYPERAAMATPERLAETLAGGNRALGVMETQLAKAPFIAGRSITVADIALFAYTQDAEYAGFDLGSYPAVAAWLDRVRADPGHVQLEWTPPEL
jgi:glutathione S-transferase